MAKEITSVTEDYLECIYRLQQRDGVARTSDIVKRLGVVPGTVTNTVERLERDGWVTHEPYKGVKLTREGGRIAIDVLRRHRLSELCLLIFWTWSGTNPTRWPASLNTGLMVKLSKILRELLAIRILVPMEIPCHREAAAFLRRSQNPL